MSSLWWYSFVLVVSTLIDSIHCPSYWVEPPSPFILIVLNTLTTFTNNIPINPISSTQQTQPWHNQPYTKHSISLTLLLNHFKLFSFYARRKLFNAPVIGRPSHTLDKDRSVLFSCSLRSHLDVFTFQISLAQTLQNLLCPHTSHSFTHIQYQNVFTPILPSLIVHS